MAEEKIERVTAEELAKDMREISVAEFFERNKHFLGYENPTKGLLTVVKEAVDNSVAWNVPVLIKCNGTQKIIKIGKFIDEQFLKYQNFVIKERNGNLEKLLNFDETYALSFDRETGKIMFKRVNALFRHKVNSKILRITLHGGRYIDVTPYHSVFGFKDGCVVPLKAEELKVGDYLITPKSWESNESLQKIEILEEILKLPSKLTKDIRVYDIRKILDKKLEEEIRKILPKNKAYRLNDFKKCDSIPLNLIRKLPTFCREKFRNCYLGFMFSKHKLKPTLFITPELVQFLGFYVAEGSTLHDLHKVYLSFGIKERKIVSYVKTLIEKVWGIRASINKAYPTAINLAIHNKNIAFLLKYILKTGYGAKKKRIPLLIFTLPSRLKEIFLLAYMSGDGHPAERIFEVLKKDGSINEVDRIITVVTTSKELSVDLQYLLSSLGFGYSYVEGKKERRIIKGRRAIFSNPYILYISPKQIKPSIQRVPISEIADMVDENLIKRFKRFGQKRIQIKTLMKILNNGGEKLESLKSFLESDLGVLEIKEIREIKYKEKFVYDFSVPGCENFAAGIGPVFCHNSLEFTTEAGILPDVKVKVKPVAEDRFKVLIEDNGPGIVKEQLPKAFAKVLYGSRFHILKQSRSLFGIGIKGACLYSQLTTGKPIRVESSAGKGPIHVFELMIDVAKNEPKIISYAAKDNPNGWHGIKIEMEVEGRYISGGHSIPNYLKQTAMVNPFAKITFDGPDEKIVFKRVTRKLPPKPKEIKPHPYGIEIGILRRMLAATQAKNIVAFLNTEFSRVGKKSAQQICKKARIDFDRKPQSLTMEESEKLYRAIQATKLMAPPTNCLSPLGESLLIDGLKKEVSPEHVVAVTRPPSVYKGMPFQVECALGFGGSLPEESALLFRFANKVPLFYHQSDCVITEAVKEVDWHRYGISQSKGQIPNGPLAILVHFASVWVPFTSEGKQAVAAYPEILKEIKLALQDAGRKLASYIRKKARLRESMLRRQIFERYLPVVAESVGELTDKKAEEILNKLKVMIKSEESGSKGET